jgi:hypothetical protein
LTPEETKRTSGRRPMAAAREGPVRGPEMEVD